MRRQGPAGGRGPCSYRRLRARSRLKKYRRRERAIILTAKGGAMPPDKFVALINQETLEVTDVLR